MNLLRKYIREMLTEKNFADLEVPKNKWVDVPEEEVSVHTPDIDLDDEIFDLIQTAYAGLEGGNIKIKSADSLPGEYTFFDSADIDDDPQPDAVVFGKMRGDALKIGGVGHDGKKGKRVSVLRLLDLLKKPGIFAELSGRPAQIAFAAGIHVVEDEQKVRSLVQRDIEWIGEIEGKEGKGWYKRQYGPGVAHVKIIVGNV
jgi:hypothetical protein|tara:strand:+ start:920 stop:1519 length:600 start_codon:yes stop_codon:yes gene_type:complete